MVVERRKQECILVLDCFLRLFIDFEERPFCMRLLHIPTLDANHFLPLPFLFNFDRFPDLFGYKTHLQPLQKGLTIVHLLGQLRVPTSRFRQPSQILHQQEATFGIGLNIRYPIDQSLLLDPWDAVRFPYF